MQPEQSPTSRHEPDRRYSTARDRPAPQQATKKDRGRPRHHEENNPHETGIPHARKAGAALAALTLSTALTACQPDSSTASAATPTSVPTPTDQASAPTSNSTGGSGNSTDNPDGSGNSTDSPNGSTDGSGSPTGSPGSSQGDAPRGLESFYSQTIDWKDCSDGTASFQCGTVTVPLDYDHPDGQTITIALKKLPASDATPSTAPCSSTPGGPGAAAWR